MSRPTKRTPERVANILRDLRIGCTRKNAAEANGIDESTFCRWLDCASFASEVRAAEGEAERQHVAVVARAAKDGDWRASESWLKRRRRAEWGDNIQQEHTGANGAPIITEIVMHYAPDDTPAETE